VTAQDSTQVPFLGIGFEQSDTGVLVTHVMPNSPAAEAGLEEGDIITAINGETVEVDTIADVIHGFNVGGQLELSIQRDGETLDLDVTLAAFAAQEPDFPLLPMDSFAYMQNGTEQVWQIRSLTENNPLYEAGLRAGDTITQFDGQVYDPTTFRKFLTGLEEDATVTVTVERGEETLEIEVPADALEVLDRFSLGFSFSDDAGNLIPFNEFFNFEPFQFFGERGDSLFNMLENMLERYMGPNGFQFNLPNAGAEV
jgi:C-terminal processing protease CtpA/Prc